VSVVFWFIVFGCQYQSNCIAWKDSSIMCWVGRETLCTHSTHSLTHSAKSRLLQITCM